MDFYRSKKWEKLVEIIKLERVNEDGELLCEHCGRPITRKYDCIGHHVIELDDVNVHDPEIALNPANIKLVHFRCHNEIHNRWDGYRKRVYLVYGAPCSGKSTWVHQNANADDLILDIDRLWEAVSFSDKYHKPNRLKANVFALRDELLDQIKLRRGMWRNAFVIGGYPLRTDRDRLCDLLGAQPVFIDEKKEVCVYRCKNDAWKKYVEDWFEDFIP